MRVRMEKTEFEDLFEQDPRARDGNLFRRDVHPANPFQIIDRNTVDELHCDHARGREFLEDEWDMSGRIAGELGSAALHCAAFGRKVEAPLDRASEPRAKLSGLYTARAGSLRSTSWARCLMMSRSGLITLAMMTAAALSRRRSGHQAEPRGALERSRRRPLGSVRSKQRSRSAVVRIPRSRWSRPG